MKFIPLGCPLNSTQMHLSKPLYLVKGQRSYEAVKITHTFKWASGLTTGALNILNRQFMVW